MINLEAIEAFAESIVAAKRDRERAERDFLAFDQAVKWLMSAEDLGELEGIRDEVNKHSSIWIVEYSKYAELLDRYYVLKLVQLQVKS